MLIELDKAYTCQSKEIQIQVGGAGTVKCLISQDNLDFVLLKTLTGGNAPEAFNVKYCKIKFTSSDDVQVSVQPDTAIS